jgi:hypothetical protein
MCMIFTKGNNTQLHTSLRALIICLFNLELYLFYSSCCGLLNFVFSQVVYLLILFYVTKWIDALPFRIVHPLQYVFPVL